MNNPLVFVFVLPQGTDASASICPSGILRLFVRSEDLPFMFGSKKVAAILARACLRPVIKSNKRMTLYWLGDVIEAADQLRRGLIQIDFANQTAVRPTTPQ